MRQIQITTETGNLMDGEELLTCPFSPIMPRLRCCTWCTAFSTIKSEKHLTPIAICKFMNGDQIIGMVVEKKQTLPLDKPR